MTRNPTGQATIGVLVLLTGAMLAAGCSSGSSPATGPAAAACTVVTPPSSSTGSPGHAETPAGSWPYPNADLANTRVAPGSTITSANVSSLVPAWSFTLTGKAATNVKQSGALAANPIVQGGVVYIQDLSSDVYALSLTTGRPLWEYRCNQPEKSGPGPNGVAVSDGKVYGLTPTAAFALDASTGRADWVNAGLLNSGQGTFGIQPQVADGRVYLASQYGTGSGGGVLMALNASTGKLVWKFNTLTGPAQGVRALGLGAGGAWETPLVSPDGSVTYGIGNPYQTVAEAIANPAKLLYTDSDVRLDAATGKLRWYYQAIPNDFKDYDLQTSPIATTVNGQSVIIASGKMGSVYEINAGTGALIWKTPVGEQNGTVNDSLLALERKITIKTPYTIAPGSLGGVLTDLAVAGGSAYVATLNIPLTYTSMAQAVPTKVAGATSGDLVAINLASGKVEWTTKVKQVPVGAATVSNNLMFTTLYDGKLLALSRRTGKVVYARHLPTSTNAPLAVAGNTVIVASGHPTAATAEGPPQIDAYTLRK
ncbi:MAG TPA: PQQ-binding-like beta-propeller repeat protein [Mycobacteriales bacterium]|nr:PQQ-binding-like beta-propeller repeat protein [Mycobacteriales bacterium]